MDICSFKLLGQVGSYQQMQQELLNLLQADWCEHVNRRDYQGTWDVLALRCAAEHKSSHPLLQSFALEQVSSWHNLPALEQSPALLRFVQQLPYPVLAVRLMRLHPEALIKPHQDRGLSLEQGEVRLHLPLQSNPGLHFYVNQQRVPMEEGQLWYINADQVHWVENKGTTARINLVLDCAVNALLKEQIYGAG